MDKKLVLSPLEELLMEPVKYYKDIKGKDIRKSICNLLGKSFGVSQENIDGIDELISIVHNASLVIDDIQDNSFLRRNHECAHIKYGVPYALNAGYMTIFKILTELNKTKELSDEAKHKIVENIYYTHMGQGMDIYYTTNKIIPSLHDYYKMMEYKTGMLFITIVDLLMEKTNNVIVKRNNDKFILASTLFSHFFQIRDDYINLTSLPYWKEKGFCQDFDEQKISFLITYYHHNKMNGYENILHLLQESKNNNKNKVNLLVLFNENGLFDIIYNILNDLKNNILELMNIQPIFDNLPFHKFNPDDVEKYFIEEFNK